MDEKEKLQSHIDTIFRQANAPHNRAAYELREELLANSAERYDDLTAGGMEPEDALETVIENIGNIADLLAALPRQSEDTAPAWTGNSRERSAFIMALAVGLYLLSAIVVFAGWMFTYYSVFAGLALAVVPTCILVYHSIKYPRYKRSDDTMVESFKQFHSDTKRVKSVKASVAVLLWSLCVVLYFIVSFTTMAWYITWVIFPATVCVHAAVNLIFVLKNSDD